MFLGTDEEHDAAAFWPVTGGGGQVHPSSLHVAVVSTILLFKVDVMGANQMGIASFFPGGAANDPSGDHCRVRAVLLTAL